MLNAIANFRKAFDVLSQKGYEVGTLSVFHRDGIYGAYCTRPEEYITFNGFDVLLDVPSDFMYFCIPTDIKHLFNAHEGCFVLSYEYEDGLNEEQLLDKRLEVSEVLLSWVEQLPSAEVAKRIISERIRKGE